MPEKERIPVLNRIPKSRVKWLIAHWLYRVIRVFLRSDHRVITRNEIKYAIDLREGIDMSLFLFGRFQEHVMSSKYLSIPDDATIFDVGANVGTMSLGLARTFKASRVFAFEPTDYAFGKLKKNLELNPELSRRIIPTQAFLSDVAMPEAEVALTPYSSWRIDKRVDGAHKVHSGTPQAARGVPASTIDEFCDENGVSSIDLIKIDTDGFEYKVLQGARRAVKRDMPYVIFELGLYLMAEHGVTFSQYEDYFSSMGYHLRDSDSGELIDESNYTQAVPPYSTIDIVAVPPQDHGLDPVGVDEHVE